MADETKALVLLVHGSRDPGWIEPFEQMRKAVEDQAPETIVAIACLQFCEPTLETAIAELANQGVKSILVAPVFISALGHVLKDVPVVAARAKKRFPGLEIEVSPALGELPEVREAMRLGLVGLAQGKDMS